MVQAYDILKENLYMAENQTAEKTATPKAPKAPKVQLVGKELVLARALRRRKKAAGRKKRSLKLRSDKEYAKTFFEGRSKRANDKKSAFRKKKTRKK
jgi:hypothetical protein